ncbi:MAG: hypothetical protein K2Y08_05815 [Alphaproteobacteria bacterium]|nr:hypothetical protein [Alphaproteobacteria bacterium]
MQKKFLRIFAILVVFIGVLGPIGKKNAYGGYTADFEEEIQQTDLSYWMCNPRRLPPIQRGHWVDATETRYVTSGISYGPMGTTTHTTTVSVPVSKFVGAHKEERIECWVCGKALSQMKPRNAPKVTFKWEHEIKILVLNWPSKKGEPHLGICRKLSLSDNMKFLWDKARLNEIEVLDFNTILNGMWNAAKIEDSKNPTITGSLSACVNETTPLSETSFETGYDVEQKYESCCCTLI